MYKKILLTLTLFLSEVLISSSVFAADGDIFSIGSIDYQVLSEAK